MAAKRGHVSRAVLVVEDNVNHAELINELLDRSFAPVVIHTVDSFGSALKFLHENQYELILTAGQVRGERILEYVQRLIEQGSGVPLIVITGSGDEHLAAELTRHGVTEYLVKSRETLELLPSLLKKHLGRSRSRVVPRGSSLKKWQKPQQRSSQVTLLEAIDQLALHAASFEAKKKQRNKQKPTPEHLQEIISSIDRLRHLISKAFGQSAT